MEGAEPLEVLIGAAKAKVEAKIYAEVCRNAKW